MYYHGNYCGPGWSNGEYQASVVGNMPGTDEFDDTCRLHDAAYALGMDLNEADDVFVRSNKFKGVKRSVAAAAVALQRQFRAFDSFSNPPNSKTIMPKLNKNALKKGNLRGTNMSSNSAPGRPNGNSTQPNKITQMNIPAASGYQLGQFKPITRRNGNTIVVSGREFGCTVNVVNNSSFGVSGMCPLTPALFQSAVLGAHAKCHEKYRFKSIVARYIPAVPTSAQGQVMLLSSKNLNMPFINSATSSFLARGLTQSNAILTPIWQAATTDVTCDNTWRNVDFISELDYDDNIMEEIQVYGWSDTTLVAGSLLIDYEIEFVDPVYQPHSSAIPDSLGPCTFVTAADDTAVNAALDAIVLTQTVLTGYGNGTIFRMVFRQSASSLPTGPATWGAVAQVAVCGALTSTTVGVTTTDMTLAEGTILFGLVRGSSLVLYSTLPNARSGSTGAIVYKSATTVVGSWYFMAHIVAIGAALIGTTQ